MTPVNFPQANAQFGPPPDMQESQCMAIRVHVGLIQGGSLDGERVVVAAWQPTPEELAVLNTGQPLFISFIGGLPPHFPCVDFEQAIHPA